MSFNPRRSRPDVNASEIVAALRQCGVYVTVIGSPVDLLTYYQGRWLPLEIKKPTFKRPRRDQERQSAFIAATGCKVVTNALQAIAAVTLKTNAPLSKPEGTQRTDIAGSAADSTILLRNSDAAHDERAPRQADNL
jgi:hypothetical protein